MQEIHPALAEQSVTPRIPPEGVVSRPAQHHVVILASEQAVAAVSASDLSIPSPP